MGFKARLRTRFHSLVGINPVFIQSTLVEIERTNERLSMVERNLGEIREFVLSINHMAGQTVEMLLAINHRALILEELAPRLTILEQLAHQLVYAEAIASEHARNANLDAESIAVLLRTLERTYSDLLAIRLHDSSKHE